MAETILSWGQPIVEITESKARAVPDNATWTEIELPKEGTLTLETSEGSKIEAIEEGGGVVDTLRGKNKYTIKFTLFEKVGSTIPELLQDKDGVIDKHLAIRITPLNEKAKGILLENCAVSVMTTYAVADGILYNYTFEALEPASGVVLKPYIKTATP